MQAVIMNCDNQSTVMLAKNYLAPTRSKYIDIQGHDQCEKVINESILF